MGRSKGLEIEEDTAFQQRDWRAQRIGWVLLALVGIAGLIGALGHGGPLAGAAAMSADGSIHARYQRFVRRRTPVQVEFTLAPGLAAPDGQVRLWLDRHYADGLDITSIQPEPEQVSVMPALLIYSFNVTDGGRPVTVTFDVEHDRVGRSAGQAGVLSRGSVTLGQFVYP